MTIKKSLDKLDKEYFNPSSAPYDGQVIRVEMQEGEIDYHHPSQILDLSGKWELSKEGSEALRLTDRWEDAINAEIPNSIQTILLEEGIIPDPYMGRQDEIARETSRYTWWLKRTFSMDELKGDYRLSFNGVCDRCMVWLNGKRLGNHQGMFDRFSYDVSSDLQKRNELVVRLDPAPYRLGKEEPNDFFNGMNIGWRDSVVINNIYGWHYINLPTVGIWQPVTLREKPILDLMDPYVVTLDLESRRLCLVVDIENNKNRDVEGYLSMQVSPDNVKGKTYSTTMPLKVGWDQKHIVMEFELPDANLWWPIGYGNQALYNLILQFIPEEGSVSQIETIFGIRTIEMSPTPEGPDPEKYNWTFVVNDKPIFIKGTNWCTCDALLRFTPERYERFISLAAASHINLLRAWGSGMPETNAFYDLCDRYGVMVLQEWPTAWDSHKIQPYDLLKASVEDSTRRLRSHASLVMYGGGNESEDPSGRVIQMMGATAYELDGTRPFHRGEPFGGSIHNYDVYWGRQRLDRNLSLSAPFIGEFGLASVPPMSTVLRYIPKSEQGSWPPPPDGGFVHHMPVFNQKGSMARMYQYAGVFVRPDSLTDLSLGTQLAQATGIRHTLELARTLWPDHTGVCYYKLNDNNPGASWSSVDWFGTQKITYHVLRQSYRPLHPCVLFESLNFVCTDVSLPVHLLDDHQELAGRSWIVDIQVYNSALDQVKEIRLTGKGCVASNESIGKLELSAAETQTMPLFVVITLRGEQNQTVQTFYWLNFESVQNSLFDLPMTKLNITRESEGIRIENTGEKPAVAIHFKPDDPDHFICSDAFFWLAPGEFRSIETNQPKSVRISAWNTKDKE